MKFVSIITILAIFIYHGIRELPELVRKQQKKDIFVFITVSIIAFLFPVLLILEIEVPSHIKIIQYIIGDVLKIGYRME